MHLVIWKPGNHLLQSAVESVCMYRLVEVYTDTKKCGVFPVDNRRIEVGGIVKTVPFAMLHSSSYQSCYSGGSVFPPDVKMTW